MIIMISFISSYMFCDFSKTKPQNSDTKMNGPEMTRHKPCHLKALSLRDSHEEMPWEQFNRRTGWESSCPRLGHYYYVGRARGQHGQCGRDHERG